MARFPENLNDGVYSCEGGMNSGLSPSLISQNQVYTSVNTTMRGGFIRNRPKYMKIELDFSGDSDAESWFKTHPISGESYYKTARGESLLCCCAGGRFFSIGLNNNNIGIVSEFTPSDSRNNQYMQHTWFCQAAQYLIAQNGQDIPVIFDGVSGVRSNIAANQVPVGRQMAYINNRLFVVSPDGRQIYPGDLAYQTPTSVLEFTEINLSPIDGGGPLGIPIEAGIINGIIATAQTDTQAGQGTLLVASEGAVTSINPITQRSQWYSIQLQNIALVGNGYSSNGLAIVNGDVWGRSVDGYRSFIMARREFSSWGNTPQSREVTRFLQYDDNALLEFSQCVYFDNRILMTVNPVPIENGCYHNGIIALNFDNISSLTSKSSPAYDGLWTGIKPYGFCKGMFGKKERCFSFCRNGDCNSLWEITKEYGDDNDVTRIQSFFESKSLNFQEAIILKQLDTCEVYVDNVWGNVDFNLKYKPDQFPCWTDWKSWSECSAKTDCDNVGFLDGVCKEPTFSELQYRPRMNTGQPTIVSNPIDGSIMSQAFEFQLKLTWTGSARIRMLRLFANNRDVNARIVK